MKYIDYDRLLHLGADVYIIYGMRSSGKTYGALKYALDDFKENGHQFVLMRTIEDDILAAKARRYIGGIKDYAESLFGYEKSLEYYSGSYLFKGVEPGDRQECGYIMSISGWLKYKGANFDNVYTIILDEFLEKRRRMMPEEYIEGWMNNLSTIIRFRDGVKVFCLGNTVAQKSPIFDYYGIDIRKVRQGQPVLFRTENGLRICAYWTEASEIESKASRHYSLGEGKTAQMITSGQWELDEYKTDLDGKSADYIMDHTRGGNMLYIPELNTTVTIYREHAVFVRGIRKAGKCKEVHLKELVNLYHVFARIQIMIRAGLVIHDGDCADDITYLRNGLF